jgi:hypothetical protein
MADTSSVENSAQVLSPLAYSLPYYFQTCKKKLAMDKRTSLLCRDVGDEGKMF